MHAPRLSLCFSLCAALVLLFCGSALSTDGQPASLNTSELAAKAAILMCEKEASLNRDAFAAKYGAGDAGLLACRQARMPAAQSLVQTALAGCQSQGSEVGGCVLQALQGALGYPAGGDRAGTSGDVMGKAPATPSPKTSGDGVQMGGGDRPKGDGDKPKGDADKGKGGSSRANVAATPVVGKSGKVLSPSTLADRVGSAVCLRESASLGMSGFIRKYGMGDAGVLACRQSQALAVRPFVQGVIDSCRVLSGHKLAACVGHKLSGALAAPKS
jgi:hypothetical protein